MWLKETFRIINAKLGFANHKRVHFGKLVSRKNHFDTNIKFCLKKTEFIKNEIT